MPRPPLCLTPLEARRFHRRAVGLDETASPVAAILKRLGYVQIDPLNVCGRMHDLILRNRVPGYTEGGLMRHLHGSQGLERSTARREMRGGFEHILPGSGILVGFPFNAWPFLQPAFEDRRRRKSGYFARLSPPEERLADRILEEIRERGPLSSDEIDHDEKAVTGWGSRGRRAKIVLEKLFAHGRVLISARRGFRRIYDLPENVLPADVWRSTGVDLEEARRWSIHMRVRQRRLISLRAEEKALLGDLVTEVQVAEGPRLWCLTEDLPLLESHAGTEDPTPRLLAPLDPLIYDRRLTSKLWDFDYTWEVYTPAAKRVRGYYTLPVLKGTCLIGHVEPRFDRELGRISVVSRKLKRRTAIAGAVRELETFLRTSL